MLKTELLEIIDNGENSGIAFKWDDIRPEQLAKEVVALANVQGGRILLGIDDDGTLIGLQRNGAEEWVFNVFRDKVHPLIIPYYEEAVIESGKRIGVIAVAAGISKPYVVRHNNREDVYVRMGSRSEFATREQQLQLYESGGLLHVESLPVAGAALDCLDRDRLEYYLASIVRDPEIPSSDAEWTRRLSGLGFMAEDSLGRTVCSLAGLLCFGIAPRRFLRQTGLRVMVFDGPDKEYRAKLDTLLDGPLVGRWKNRPAEKTLLDEGLIEKFASKIEPFIVQESETIDENMRRTKHWFYPREAVREAVLNALVHRDWTRSVDIEVSVYSDRMEIISPGRLQNSMTVEKMTAGQRLPRNPILMDVLRDYGYVDARGMGVRTKIIPLMKQCNGVEPLFEATDDFLRTVLPSVRREA